MAYWLVLSWKLDTLCGILHCGSCGGMEFIVQMSEWAQCLQGDDWGLGQVGLSSCDQFYGWVLPPGFKSCIVWIMIQSCWFHSQKSAMVRRRRAGWSLNFQFSPLERLYLGWATASVYDNSSLTDDNIAFDCSILSIFFPRAIANGSVDQVLYTTMGSAIVGNQYLGVPLRVIVFVVCDYFTQWSLPPSPLVEPALPFTGL